MIAPATLAPTLVPPPSALMPADDRAGAFDAMLASLAPAAGGTPAASPVAVAPVPAGAEEEPAADGAGEALSETDDRPGQEETAASEIAPPMIVSGTAPVAIVSVATGSTCAGPTGRTASETTPAASRSALLVGSAGAATAWGDASPQVSAWSAAPTPGFPVGEGAAAPAAGARDGVPPTLSANAPPAVANDAAASATIVAPARGDAMSADHNGMDRASEAAATPTTTVADSDSTPRPRPGAIPASALQGGGEAKPAKDAPVVMVQEGGEPPIRATSATTDAPPASRVAKATLQTTETGQGVTPAASVAQSASIAFSGSTLPVPPSDAVAASVPAAGVSIAPVIGGPGPATLLQNAASVNIVAQDRSVASSHRRPGHAVDDIAAITGLDLEAVFPKSGEGPLAISYPGDTAAVQAAAPPPLTVASAAVTPDAAAVAAPADVGIMHHLEVAHDGAWLDRLARDIALSGDREQRMRFQLNPERLGALTVDIAPAGDGAAVRFTTDNEAARAMIADAQPRLVAEARAQGTRIADMQVDLSGGQGGGAGGGQGGAANPFAQGEHQPGQQGQPRQPAPRGFTAARAAATPRVGTAANAERYA